MAIKELEQNNKRRVPTPENPIFMKNKNDDENIVMFVSEKKGISIDTGKNSNNYLCGVEDNYVPFDDGIWQPVKLNFTPCEPEYDKPELKLPFARKWRTGEIIVYYVQDNNGEYIGIYVGECNLGTVWVNSQDAILKRSIPIQILGPSKTAKVRYPALYRNVDGTERLYSCDGNYINLSNGLSYKGNPNCLFDLKEILVVDNPSFPQCESEWDYSLPFGFETFNQEKWVAFQLNGGLCKSVCVRSCYSSIVGQIKTFHIDPSVISHFKPCDV